MQGVYNEGYGTSPVLYNDVHEFVAARAALRYQHRAQAMGEEDAQHSIMEWEAVQADQREWEAAHPNGFAVTDDGLSEVHSVTTSERGAVDAEMQERQRLMEQRIAELELVARREAVIAKERQEAAREVREEEKQQKRNEDWQEAEAKVALWKAQGMTAAELHEEKIKEYERVAMQEAYWQEEEEAEVARLREREDQLAQERAAQFDTERGRLAEQEVTYKRHLETDFWRKRRGLPPVDWEGRHRDRETKLWQAHDEQQIFLQERAANRAGLRSVVQQHAEVQAEVEESREVQRDQDEWFAAHHEMWRQVSSRGTPHQSSSYKGGPSSSQQWAAGSWKPEHRYAGTRAQAPPMPGSAVPSERSGYPTDRGASPNTFSGIAAKERALLQRLEAGGSIRDSTPSARAMTAEERAEIAHVEEQRKREDLHRAKLAEQQRVLQELTVSNRTAPSTTTRTPDMNEVAWPAAPVYITPQSSRFWEDRTNAAATEIQRIVRGFLAREYVRQLRQDAEDEEYEEKEHAADVARCVLNLQAIWRGKKGRRIARERRWRKYKEEKEAIEKELSVRAARERAVDERARLEIELREEQEAFRQAESAAMLIQKNWRGVATRIQWPLIRQAILAERVVQLQEEWTAAAIVIQSGWRMYDTRMAVEEMHDAGTIVQSWFRGCLGRQQAAIVRDVAIRNGAACKVQSLWRGHRGRQDVETLRKIREEQRLAAVKLQSLQRGRQGRSQAVRRRDELRRLEEQEEEFRKAQLDCLSEEAKERAAIEATELRLRQAMAMDDRRRREAIAKELEDRRLQELQRTLLASSSALLRQAHAEKLLMFQEENRLRVKIDEDMRQELDQLLWAEVENARKAREDHQRQQRELMEKELQALKWQEEERGRQEVSLREAERELRLLQDERRQLEGERSSYQQQRAVLEQEERRQLEEDLAQLALAREKQEAERTILENNVRSMEDQRERRVVQDAEDTHRREIVLQEDIERRALEEDFLTGAIAAEGAAMARIQLEWENQAATVIQAGYRGAAGRAELARRRAKYEEDMAAATKIQAAYRGHLVRRRRRDKARKEEEERLAALAELQRRDDAAQGIQRQYRAHIARVELERRRAQKAREQAEAASRIQGVYKNRAAREAARRERAAMHAEQEGAATTLQAAFRGRRGRRYADEVRSQEEAATLVQAAYRGHQGRQVARGRRTWAQQVEEERAGFHDDEALCRADVESQEVAERQDMTAMTQGLTAVLSQLRITTPEEVERVVIEEEEARQWNEFQEGEAEDRREIQAELERFMANLQNGAATKMQAIARRYLTRRDLQKKQSSAGRIQRAWRHQKEREQMAMTQEYNKHGGEIRRIQAVWRGYIAREWFKANRVYLEIARARRTVRKTLTLLGPIDGTAAYTPSAALAHPHGGGRATGPTPLGNRRALPAVPHKRPRRPLLRQQPAWGTPVTKPHHVAPLPQQTTADNMRHPAPLRDPHGEGDTTFTPTRGTGTWDGPPRPVSELSMHKGSLGSLPRRAESAQGQYPAGELTFPPSPGSTRATQKRAPRKNPKGRLPQSTVDEKKRRAKQPAPPEEPHLVVDERQDLIDDIRNRKQRIADMWSQLETAIDGEPHPTVLPGLYPTAVA